MVDVVDLLESPDSVCTATASKPPISPGITKEGLSEASDCMSVVGPHVLVAVEDGQAVLVLDRDDRVLEAAFFPGLAARFWLSTA